MAFNHEYFERLKERYRDPEVIMKEYTERYPKYDPDLIRYMYGSLKEAELASWQCNIVEVIARYIDAAHHMASYLQRLYLEHGVNLHTDDMEKFTATLEGHIEETAKRLEERCGLRRSRSQ